MAGDLGLILVASTLIISLVLTVIRFGGVIFRLPVQIGAFAFHRLGIFRKLPEDWHAPIPRTSGITCTLNCQACELAWLGCPIGMLQRYVIDTKLPLYVFGILLAFGAALGRTICGWLCPFGLILDGLNKFCKHTYSPPEWLRFVKYAFLGGVILMAALTGAIFWCRYLCFGAMLGVIPYWLTWQTVSAFWLFYHIIVFSAFVAFSYVSHGRAWCRYFCPLGATLAILNPIAIVRKRYDWKWCTHCDACKKVCPMAIDPTKTNMKTRMECIKCGRCVTACKSHSLSIAPVFSGTSDPASKNTSAPDL
jgi:ferredoxin-type protein NapH